jgi:hypothetical protein
VTAADHSLPRRRICTEKYSPPKASNLDISFMCAPPSGARPPACVHQGGTRRKACWPGGKLLAVPCCLWAAHAAQLRSPVRHCVVLGKT